MAESNQLNQIASDLEKLEKELAGKGAAPAKGGKKKARVARRRNESVWAGKLSQGFAQLNASFREVLQGLHSPDRPTRRMARLFLASVVALAAVSSVALYRVVKMIGPKPGELTEAQLEAKHMSEFFRKQAEDNKHRASMIALGNFTVELKPLANQAPSQGAFNLAEIELVLDCDSKDTKDFVENNLVKARNEVTGVLTAVDRNELMSRDGKKKLRKLMVDRLNLWLPHGKVEDLYITRLLLS